MDNSDNIFPGIPCSNDVLEAAAIRAVLLWRCQFRVQSVEMLAEPAVYILPGYDCTKLFIYGDYTEAERNLICAEVERVANQLQTKPIEVFFYPDELQQNKGLIECRLLKSQNA